MSLAQKGEEKKSEKDKGIFFFNKQKNGKKKNYLLVCLKQNSKDEVTKVKLLLLEQMFVSKMTGFFEAGSE
jgi:hypothetical protein